MALSWPSFLATLPPRQRYARVRASEDIYGIEGSIWVFGALGGAPEQSQVSRIHISMGSRAQFGYLGLGGGPPNSRKLAESTFLWDGGLNLGI